MVTNIFASETNKKALRKSHDGHDPQKDPALNTSEGYLAANRKLVELFVREHVALATDLSCVETHFNPIRAYFHGHCAPAWTPAVYRPGKNVFR